MDNKTWHLIPPYSTKTIIDCKWVYRIKKMQMVLLMGTKHAWLQQVSSKDMASTMKIPSTLSSKQLLSDLFWQLLFQEAGVCGS
jgi:hypothetical protein